MKISQLIKKLQDLQEKHGSDTQIYTSGAFDDLHDIDDFRVVNGYDFNSYEPKGDFETIPKNSEIFIVL